VSEPRTILVADDEANLARGIAENLIAEGYRVTTVSDGPSALAELVRGAYDLVVLDVMMPGLDGFAVCAEARRQGIATPVLFLTAKGGIDDRIRGLEAGGDDYLPKPFHLQELLLRVRVILRRWSWYARPGRERRPARLRRQRGRFRTFRGRAFDGSPTS
jgi:DNA-binding response OmpR family regulator